MDERVITVDKTCKMEMEGKRAEGTTGQEVRRGRSPFPKDFPRGFEISLTDL